MAIKLQDKENVIPPGSPDYPFGDIKDDPGDETGTPVNRAVYGDFHQFFAKLMDVAGLAYNDIRDGINGIFQYWTAMTMVFLAKAGGTMTGFLTLSGTPTDNLHAAPKNYVDTIYTNALAYFNARLFDVAPGSLVTPVNFTPTKGGIINLSGVQKQLKHCFLLGIQQNVTTTPLEIWDYNSGYLPLNDINMPVTINNAGSLSSGYLIVNSLDGKAYVRTVTGTVTYNSIDVIIISVDLSYNI